jgi:hypothetical protein
MTELSVLWPERLAAAHEHHGNQMLPNVGDGQKR